MDALILNLKKFFFLSNDDSRFKKLTKGSESTLESDDENDNGMQKSIELAETILKKIK